jgi:N-dimethylarginine dimethylaminohydrolase
LQSRYPEAIIVSEADAAVLGLNVVSDGLNVVMPVQAADFADQLRAEGFAPALVNLSELLKAGGGVKCCTMALRFSDPSGSAFTSVTPTLTS